MRRFVLLLLAFAAQASTTPPQRATPPEVQVEHDQSNDDRATEEQPDEAPMDEGRLWAGALTDANESILLLRFEPLLAQGSRFRDPLATLRAELDGKPGDDLLASLERAALDASPILHVRGGSDFRLPAQHTVGGYLVEGVWITEEPITLPGAPDDAPSGTDDLPENERVGTTPWTDQGGASRTIPIHARLVNPTTLVIARDAPTIDRILDRRGDEIDERLLLSSPDLDLEVPIVILRDLTRNQTFPAVDHYAVTVPDVVDGAVHIHWIGGGREEHQNQMFHFTRLLPFEPLEWAPFDTPHGRAVTMRPEHTDLYTLPPERVLMIAFGVFDFR